MDKYMKVEPGVAPPIRDGVEQVWTGAEIARTFLLEEYETLKAQIKKTTERLSIDYKYELGSKVWVVGGGIGKVMARAFADNIDGTTTEVYWIGSDGWVKNMSIDMIDRFVKESPEHGIVG